MKLLALHSSPISTSPSLSNGISRRDSMEKSAFFSGQALAVPGAASSKRYTDARKSSASVDFRVRAVGSVGSSQKAANVNEPEKIANDKDLVFVAGATGRVGSRTVRELLKLGFRVRAGVRSTQKAETLVKSVQQMKLDDSSGSTRKKTPKHHTMANSIFILLFLFFVFCFFFLPVDSCFNNRDLLVFRSAVEKLEIVQCDLENQSEIRPAIGNASIVICCIGASEKEISDITGPYRIDYKATENLINAATVAKVDHFILLTSLGTNKIGFPAAILNLFWGVLTWKRKAEEALIASGLPYTIVRPGGMERPTDAFKETHNITLAYEDTLFGGQVSNLQVAELMACMAKNRRLSYCKVVEVIAETTAPLTPMEELLAKIPSKRELPAEPLPDPVPTKIDSKPEEVTQLEASKPRPLSPYTMYDDLKPPTSPTPTPSTTPSSSHEQFTSPTQKPLSPNYIAHEDSKPPTSPTPKPLSPFTMYEDMKPPTSPMPSLPKN